MGRRVAGKRDQDEQRSERRFKEALYRGIVGLRSTLERQTGVLVALERSMRQVEQQTAQADAQRKNDELEEARRRRAQQKHDELTDPKLVGDRLMFVTTFASLRMLFVHVPPKHYERIAGAARITCKCEEQLEVAIRSFHQCDCGRLYVVTEDTVKVIPQQAVAA